MCLQKPNFIILKFQPLIIVPFFWSCIKLLYSVPQNVSVLKMRGYANPCVSRLSKVCGSSRSFYEKMDECSEILSSWGQEITGSFKKRVHQCKRILKNLKGRRDDASVKLIKEEQKKLSEVYAQQEIFWRQRSKQLWLREGDHNSRYFHASMKNRRTFNQIRSLRNENGQEVQWSSGLEDVITGYFSKLFTASATHWTEIVQCIDNKVTEPQNAMLLSPVEAKEVKEALFHMHRTKVQGQMELLLVSIKNFGKWLGKM